MSEMFNKRKEKACLRAECKEILKKQLQLLSEYSMKCDVYGEMERVTQAMIEIAAFLCSTR